MKNIRNFVAFIVCLQLFSCDDPIQELVVPIVNCNLERIDSWYGTEDTARRDSIVYGADGKMQKGYRFIKPPGQDWEYDETRVYTYFDKGMSIKITRGSNQNVVRTGTFVFNDENNLLEFYDDFFARRYKYNYNAEHVLESLDSSIRYVVKDGNITQRIDIATGNVIDTFTYDRTPNPLHGLFFEPIGADERDYFKFYNKNNVFTEDPANVLMPNKTFIYSYATNGLATSKLRYGTDQVFNYIYKCK